MTGIGIRLKLISLPIAPSPCHSVTLSPIALSPCHPVTPSPYHPSLVTPNAIAIAIAIAIQLL